MVSFFGVVVGNFMEWLMVVGIFCVVVGLSWLVVGLFCIAVGGGRWW